MAETTGTDWAPGETLPGPVAGSGKRRWRLRLPGIGTASRLAAFHALIIATVLGIVVFEFTQAFASRYETTITRDLTENVSAFSRAAAIRPATQPLQAFTRAFLATHGPAGADVVIVSLTGHPPMLGTPGSGKLARAPKIGAYLAHAPKATVLTRTTVNGVPELVLAAPISDHGKTVGTFLTAGGLASYQHTRTHFLELAVAEGLITLLAAVASVYVLLRRLLASVRRLTRAAADIGLRGELGIRLGDRQGADEVGEMAATFDAMVDKIDTAMSVQRRMLADVSHQLRTPLTVARGHLEVMSRGPLDDPDKARTTVATVVDELDHMRLLTERLLLLGRSLEADFVDLRPVDLRAMLFDIADAVELLAPRHWAVGPIPDVVLQADLEKLRGAIFNLVENAVHATGPGDSIRLSADLVETPDGRLLDISVDDSGPGIPPSDRQAALGRFARPSATDTEGTGLGLAIVEAVAVAHNGRVEIGDSPLGGCRVTISLSVAPVGPDYPAPPEQP